MSLFFLSYILLLLFFCLWLSYYLDKEVFNFASGPDEELSKDGNYASEVNFYATTDSDDENSDSK